MGGHRRQLQRAHPFSAPPGGWRLAQLDTRHLGFVVVVVVDCGRSRSCWGSSVSKSMGLPDTLFRGARYPVLGQMWVQLDGRSVEFSVQRREQVPNMGAKRDRPADAERCSSGSLRNGLVRVRNWVVVNRK